MAAKSLQDARDDAVNEACSLREALCEAQARFSMGKEALEQAQVICLRKADTVTTAVPCSCASAPRSHFELWLIRLVTWGCSGRISQGSPSPKLTERCKHAVGIRFPKYQSYVPDERPEATSNHFRKLFRISGFTSRVSFFITLYLLYVARNNATPGDVECRHICFSIILQCHDCFAPNVLKKIVTIREKIGSVLSCFAVHLWIRYQRTTQLSDRLCYFRVAVDDKIFDLVIARPRVRSVDQFFHAAVFCPDRNRDRTTW